ncbi:MAG TPA: GNA1162 family protein, partial [Candidatus Polarisedimenticolia bacterium]|nr:GNA1162 family protein [Candidatus Polarisedimenticolia bacterium]
VTFHDPNMDFSLIRSVAVLPFANLTVSPKAEDRAREVFMTMLQATGATYVIPPGEVARGISRSALSNPVTPTTEDVVRLAKNLEADVVITGTVLEYGEVRSATTTANVISLNVQMMEGQTGKVIWTGASTKGGIDAGKRLFGGGGEPMNDVTADAVNDLLHRLFK